MKHKNFFSSENITKIFGVCLLFFALATCYCCQTVSKAQSGVMSLPESVTETVVNNPTYGAMIFGQPDSLVAKSRVLKALGVNVVRESIVTKDWPNNTGRLDYWQKNGYKVVLNISYMQQAQVFFNNETTRHHSINNFNLCDILRSKM